MTDRRILRHDADGLCTLVLDGPEKLNALNTHGSALAHRVFMATRSLQTAASCLAPDVARSPNLQLDARSEE